MSLEQAIAALTAAVQANTEAVVKFGTMLSGSVVAPPVIPAPQQATVPAAAPPAPPAQPEMPPAPSWTATPAAPPAAPAGLPFGDTNGLVKYATDAYEAIKGKDPGVGAKIQAAFTSLGYADIQQMQPHHYQEFYNRVESLR